MGHFQVDSSLCFKARLSVKPLIWKWFFILIQINFIFTRKVLHLALFRKWEFLELGNGQLRFAVTERVERVVVLNKLDFEWRTGTENDKSTSQKQKKTRKRSRIVCHHLRKAGLPGLQGSILALANSQKPSSFPKLPVKRKSSSKNWRVLKHFSSGNLREKMIVVEESLPFFGLKNNAHIDWLYERNGLHVSHCSFVLFTILQCTFQLGTVIYTRFH